MCIAKSLHSFSFPATQKDAQKGALLPATKPPFSPPPAKPLNATLPAKSTSAGEMSAWQILAGGGGDYRWEPFGGRPGTALEDEPNGAPAEQRLPDSPLPSMSDLLLQGCEICCLHFRCGFGLVNL